MGARRPRVIVELFQFRQSAMHLHGDSIPLLPRQSGYFPVGKLVGIFHAQYVLIRAGQLIDEPEYYLPIEYIHEAIGFIGAGFISLLDERIERPCLVLSVAIHDQIIKHMEEESAHAYDIALSQKVHPHLYEHVLHEIFAQLPIIHHGPRVARELMAVRMIGARKELLLLCR